MADEAEFLTDSQVHATEILFAADELPSYRLALKGCHQWSYIELQLDAAELDLVQRIAAKFDANTRERCAPTILFDRRVKPGALEFDSNFTGA